LPHHKNFCFKLLGSLWFLFLAVGQTVAQDSTATTKLVDRLEQLKTEYGADFSYNFTYLDQIRVPATNDCNSLANCLESLRKLAPVDFQANGTNNYIVLPIRKDISFSIEDADTKEQLSGISVQVNSGAEEFLYPKKSKYTIRNIFPLDSIHIHSAFYKSIHLKVSQLGQLNVPLQMESLRIQLNEVQINDYLTRGINAKIGDNSFQINMKSLGLLAGETDGDIFNVLKNIPGINTPSGKPGSLNFRGSTFDQSLIQIDDIPIYHNGHFYGALAPYNPTIVNHIEIQRNALSAKWGGRVGGLIHMTTNNAVPDSTEYAVQLNTVYGGATIKLPIVNEKLAFYLAGRSNYPTINSPKLTAFSVLNFQGSRLQSIAEEVNSESLKVGFHDINSKLVYDINENHKATISYINIINRLSATLNDVSDQNRRDFRDFDLDNWGMTAKWQGRLSEKFSAQARYSKSKLIIDNVSQGFSGNERSNFEKYTNTIDDSRFITEINLKVNQNTTLESGYTITNYTLRFDERNDQNGINDRKDQDAMVHSLFLLMNKNWNDKLSANIGVHTDYYAPSRRFYVDPRLTVNIPANNALYFKTSFGRSHQFIQKKLRDDFDDFNDETQFWFLPDPTTAVLEGYQTMIGALYKKSGWLFDLELYNKRTNNITTQTNANVLNTGKLTSNGADLFIKKRWNAIETMLSYSLNKVDTRFEETAPIFFDQRHILQLTGLWHLGAFNFALTWSYATGMPVIIPEFNTNGQSEFSIPYSNRFPDQHQLDVSATYSFTDSRKSWRGIIGLSLINLYDQENIINIFQNSPSIENPFREAMGFAPNLQLSFQF